MKEYILYCLAFHGNDGIYGNDCIHVNDKNDANDVNDVNHCERSYLSHAFTQHGFCSRI